MRSTRRISPLPPDPAGTSGSPLPPGPDVTIGSPLPPDPDPDPEADNPACSTDPPRLAPGSGPVFPAAR